MAKLLNIKRFYGMVTIGSPIQIPTTHCIDQSDMSHTLLDTISTRAGFTKLNTTAFSGGILGLFDYKRKSQASTILSATDNGDWVSGSSE